MKLLQSSCCMGIGTLGPGAKPIPNGEGDQCQAATAQIGEPIPQIAFSSRNERLGPFIHNAVSCDEQKQEEVMRPPQDASLCQCDSCQRRQDKVSTEVRHFVQRQVTFFGNCGWRHGNMGGRENCQPIADQQESDPIQATQHRGVSIHDGQRVDRAIKRCSSITPLDTGANPCRDAWQDNMPGIDEPIDKKVNQE